MECILHTRPWDADENKLAPLKPPVQERHTHIKQIHTQKLIMTVLRATNKYQELRLGLRQVKMNDEDGENTPGIGVICESSDVRLKPEYQA